MKHALRLIGGLLLVYGTTGLRFLFKGDWLIVVPCVIGTSIGAYIVCDTIYELIVGCVNLRNRPVHDTETDGRIDDSGLKE